MKRLSLFVVAAMACLCQEAGELRVGFARVDITPPVGAYMPGHFEQRIAVGSATALDAACVAFANGRESAVVFSVDNIHLTKKTIDSVRRILRETDWILPEHVFVHSTHVHTGAATDSSYYYTDIGDERARRICDGYGDMLVARLVEVAEKALTDARPARFQVGRAEVSPAVSFVRRYRMKDGSVVTNPDREHPELVDCALGESDNCVQVVRIIREGAPDLALVNFQMHPDTVRGVRYDADWPGRLRSVFERAVDDGTRLFFMNGAQGDSNHHQVLGDNPFWKTHARSECCSYIGRALAGAILQIWDRCVSVPSDDSILGVITPVKVESNRPDAKRMEAIRLFDEGRADDIRGFGKMEIMALTAKDSNARTLMSGPEFFEMPISTLAIGGVIAFAGFPGEPFTEIGLKVKSSSPFSMTFVGCLVNDSSGYLPSSSAFREGGYEVMASRFGASCGETLVKSQLDNLGLLKSKTNACAFR